MSGLSAHRRRKRADIPRDSREIARRTAIDDHALVFLVLGFVDGRVGRAVDDGVRLDVFDKGTRGVKIPQREFFSRGTDGFVTARSKRFHDIVAELACNAGYEDFHSNTLS